MKDARILIIGLDSAGKTTLLYRLKLGALVTAIPTVGFNVETVKYKNINFSMWDASGQEQTRKFWRYYYENVRIIIFVVDSNDRERFTEARDELHKLMDEPLLINVPLLLFCNKQDLPNAAPSNELEELFQIPRLNRKFKVQAIVALSGQGIYDGLDWVVDTLTNM